MENQGIEKLTLKQLIGSLTVVQIVSVISAIVIIFSTGFTVGSKFTQNKGEKDISRLERSLNEYKVDNNSLKEQFTYFEKKGKFLELTSTIQFKSALLDLSLWRSNGKIRDRFLIRDSLDLRDEIIDAYEDYTSLLDELASTDDPIANISVPRAGPRILQFKLDKTSYVVLPNVKYSIERNMKACNCN